jgi:hypothetical protein
VIFENHIVPEVYIVPRAFIKAFQHIIFTRFRKDDAMGLEDMRLFSSNIGESSGIGAGDGIIVAGKYTSRRRKHELRPICGKIRHNYIRNYAGDPGQ